MVDREMRFRSQSGKKGTESEGMRQGGKHTDREVIESISV